MYTNEQLTEHIRGLQQDLRVIGASNHEPMPKISGVYDISTEDAVRRFQRRYGLPITGETDLITWDRVVMEANRIRSISAIPLAVRVFPSAAHVISPGDSGRFLYILQAVLNGLASEFNNLSSVPYSGVYDTATEKAIKALQKNAGLPQNGKLDATTWNAIAHFYSKIGLFANDND